jgi:hypothetical protein
MHTQLNIRLRVFCLATAVASLTAIACDYPVERGEESDYADVRRWRPRNRLPRHRGTWQRTIETIDEFAPNVSKTTWLRT